MRKTRNGARAATILPGVLLAGACVTTKYVATGAVYPPREEGCVVEVFSTAPPQRPYEEIGLVEAEGSLWKADLEDVLPELRKEACHVGGDALVLLSANRYATGGDDVLDDEELYAVATVIKWLPE